MNYHIARDGTQLGTFSIEDVRAGVESGRFLPTDLAWSEGMPDWQTVQSLGVVPVAAPPGLPPTPPPVQAQAAAVPPVVPQAAFPQPGQPAVPTLKMETATCGQATASLILGVLSCGLSCLTSIPAVILGHVALSKIKKSGGLLSGRGLAIAGLIFGYLNLIALPVIWAVAIPSFINVQNKAQEMVAMNQGRQVIIALKMYASDHNGRYPADLHDLVNERVLDTASALTYPAITGWSGGNSWDYFGAKMSDADDAKSILISSQCSGPNGKRIIGYNDGSVNVETPHQAGN